jgi:hypothetical protein
MSEALQRPASEHPLQTFPVSVELLDGALRVIERRLSPESFSTGALTISFERLAQEFGGTSTGAIFVVPVKDILPNGIVSTQFQLSYVKSVFELPVAELSRLLHVTRQTIYNWFGDDDESLSTIQAPHRDRVFALYRAAQIWSDKHGNDGKSPGRFLLHKLSNGNSVLDLLRADPIDWVQLQKGFNDIDNLVLANKHSQSLRADKIDLSIFSVTPPEARHGTLARLKLSRD